MSARMYACRCRCRRRGMPTGHEATRSVNRATIKYDRRGWRNIVPSRRRVRTYERYENRSNTHPRTHSPSNCNKRRLTNAAVGRRFIYRSSAPFTNQPASINHTSHHTAMTHWQETAAAAPDDWRPKNGRPCTRTRLYTRRRRRLLST